MHFEAVRRAVHRDDDAVGGQQRVIVDERDLGGGEADPVAQQCGTAFGPGKVAGIVLAECRGADALVGTRDGQPVLGQKGVQASAAEVVSLNDVGQRGREVGGLDDQGPTAR